jgi:hypothetical protein
MAGTHATWTGVVNAVMISGSDSGRPVAAGSVTQRIAVARR